ncbi:MAG: hypothetical protein R3Y26_09130 [Rikenellaceae bacterium]
MGNQTKQNKTKSNSFYNSNKFGNYIDYLLNKQNSEEIITEQNHNKDNSWSFQTSYMDNDVLNPTKNNKDSLRFDNNRKLENKRAEELRDSIITKTISIEGGLSNNKYDKGKTTNKVSKPVMISTPVKEKNDFYHFSGGTTQLTFIPDIGIRGNYNVKGWSKKDKDNLNVHISTQNIPELDMSGSVEVKQNGKIYSSDSFKLNPSGYFYETGTPKPLGNARVKLPSHGEYSVDVNVFGLYNDGTGRYSVNYNKKLPYGKK